MDLFALAINAFCSFFVLGLQFEIERRFGQQSSETKGSIELFPDSVFA